MCAVILGARRSKLGPLEASLGSFERNLEFGGFRPMPPTPLLGAQASQVVGAVACPSDEQSDRAALQEIPSSLGFGRFQVMSGFVA